MPNWKALPGKGAIYFNGEFCGRASSSSKLEPLINRGLFEVLENSQAKKFKTARALLNKPM